MQSGAMAFRPFSRALTCLWMACQCLSLAATFPSQSQAQPSAVIDLADVATDPRRFGRVHGSSGEGATGVPVAGGFDVDGDTHADFALAAMQASPLGREGAGEVHLIFGDGGFAGTLDTAVPSQRILRIIGTGKSEAAGSEIWMDDVTGDGLGDLLIARQNHSPDPGRPGAGALTIVVGTPALRSIAEAGDLLDLAAAPLSVKLVTLVGANATDRLGIWVRAGDVTGDGISELLVGADQEDEIGQNDSGALYLVRGGPHLAETAHIDLADFGTTAFTGHIAKMIPPPGSHEFHFGSTCAIGDLDGNGRGEVLSAAALNRAGATLRADGSEFGSAHGLGGSLDGTAYVIWDDNFPEGLWPAGYTVATNAAPGSITAIEGSDANRKFGEELLGGLDYDGDGTADLFVGDIVGDLSPGADRRSSGSGHVFYNAATLKGLVFDLETPPGGIETTTILGAQRSDIAADTAAHGDFDGDGHADLMVSSPHAAPLGRSSAGALHVLFGGTRWPETVDLRVGEEPSSAELRFTAVYGALASVGQDAGDTLCYSAAAGDLDGDGKTDLIGNEMQGNGLAPETVDDGNLVIFSGAMLAGRSGSDCPLRPAAGCREAAAGAGKLRLVNRKGRDLDRFTWRWRGGPETTVEDFLEPTLRAATSYNLCLYIGEDSQFDALSADVEALGNCAGLDCWNTTLDGYLYKDPQGSASGMRTLRLRAGIDGTGRLYARGAGPNVELPAGPIEHPVLVQLSVDDGETAHCWESLFSDFVRNDGRVLRAQGD